LPARRSGDKWYMMSNMMAMKRFALWLAVILQNQIQKGDIQLITFLCQLNMLELWVTYVSNAYLETTTKGKKK
jgi:hypothetical protein